MKLTETIMFKEPSKDFKLNEFVNNKTISLKDKFEKLTYEWKIRYDMLSFDDQKQNNIHYKAIINLGKDVLPLMIEDMRNDGNSWFDAFEKFTGVWPVPNGLTKTKEVKKYLVNWYDENKDNLK
jgi:hypothetical protein